MTDSPSQYLTLSITYRFLVREGGGRPVRRPRGGIQGARGGRFRGGASSF